MENMVSIVVPVYNMGEKLEKCIDSLIAQTYSNIEILLIDDGSTDNSFLVCQQLAQKDSRVKVFQTKNQGAGPARNYGIEQASGKYIYFPDADDYLEPNAIEILERNMSSNGCDLVVFGYKNVNQNGEVQGIKEYEPMVWEAEAVRKDYSDFITMEARYSIQGAPWNKFFSLNVIKENKITYPPLRRHQDEAFIARYMTYAKKICFISDVLYVYYVNDLKKEWDKYPVDYIDAVTGLFEERKTNILRWNPEDIKTHDIVYREYLCNVIKTLELSFSPKHGFNRKKRTEWIKKTIINSRIKNIHCPSCTGKYQKMVYKMIAKENYLLLYATLYVKVIVHKMGWLEKVKGILR